MTTATTPDESYKEFFTAAGKLSKLALQQKVFYGEIIGCAPVGYKNIEKDGRKCAVVDPTKAPYVQVAFHLAGDSNMTLPSILKMVTDLGLTSRNGKPLGPAALWGILTNPFYVGKIRHQGETLDGRHESIVSEELFEKVQKNLSKRSKSKAPANRTGGS